MRAFKMLQRSPGKALLILSLMIMAAHIPLPVSAQQQDSTALFQIKTTDGNTYLGNIILEDDEKILLKSDKLGEITLHKKDVLSINPVNASNVKNGVHWFDNPQSTRYFLAPNGYGLNKGEGYYQNIWVLFNQFSVGVTDNFSIGGGLVPLFLFSAGVTPIWLTPKFSIPVRQDKFNIGAGGLFGTVIGESNTSFGIVYGLTTFGNRDTNLSLGLGYGYADGGWANSPTITVSSLIRTGQRGYFLTENYIIGTGDGALVLLSLGGRRIINRAGLDFGAFIPFADGLNTLIIIPWLGLTVPFGKSQKK